LSSAVSMAICSPMVHLPEGTPYRSTLVNHRNLEMQSFLEVIIKTLKKDIIPVSFAKHCYMFTLESFSQLYMNNDF
jgi:hypothetical protein